MFELGVNRRRFLGRYGMLLAPYAHTNSLPPRVRKLERTGVMELWTLRPCRTSWGAYRAPI